MPIRTSEVWLGRRYRAVLEVIVQHGPLSLDEVDDHLPRVDFPSTYQLVVPELVRQSLVLLGENDTVHATDAGHAVVAGVDQPIPPSREDVARQLNRAQNSVSFIMLGAWAGRGDWARTSQEARDKSGHRALRELDAALVELVAAREALAATLGPADGDAEQ